MVRLVLSPPYVWAKIIPVGEGLATLPTGTRRSRTPPTQCGGVVLLFVDSYGTGSNCSKYTAWSSSTTQYQIMNRRSYMTAQVSTGRPSKCLNRRGFRASTRRNLARKRPNSSVVSPSSTASAQPRKKSARSMTSYGCGSAGGIGGYPLGGGDVFFS